MLIEPFDHRLAQRARVELGRAGDAGRAQHSQERKELAVPIRSGREDAEPVAELGGDARLEHRAIKVVHGEITCRQSILIDWRVNLAGFAAWRVRSWEI